MTTIQVALVNASRLSDKDVAEGMAALQRQVSDDFAPVWHVDAELRLVPRREAFEPRELGDQRAIALLLDNLGVMAAFLDDHETALVRLEEALAAMRGLGDPVRVANSLANLGMLALYRGLVEEASDRYAESLRILEALDAPGCLAECLEGFACIAAHRGRAERALCLAGAAAAIRETIGTPQPPWSRRIEDEWVAGARQSVGPGAARAWEEGRKLLLPQLVPLALEELSE